MEHFLRLLSPVQAFELFAALAGTYYLRKTGDTSFIRYFVWFLWFSFFVELLGTYAGVAYFSDYRLFSFVKGTPFAGNYWLYNISSIIAFSVYITLFTSLLQNITRRKSLKITLLVYILAAIINLLLTDVYFQAHSVFTFFAGTIIVIIAIGMYYFELLKSDELLSISSSVPFYISIGALVYHLGFVPLVIYSRYFKQSSPDFVEIYIFILYGINYFIYSLYTLGFLLCSRKKRSF